MPEYRYNNLNEFLNGWKDNDKYFEMLSLMAQLSRLFSESDVPYLDYRLAENLFCRYYKAMNDARSCTAYDARISGIGIGIKTFILNNNQSREKIAEFNKLKPTLESLHGLDLARKIGSYRNDRMRLANSTFDVNETTYHVVGRTSGMLRIFNCPYEEVDIDNILLRKEDDKTIIFEDGKNEYSFTKSKSVLMKRFKITGNDYKDVKIEILENPLELLEEFFGKHNQEISEAKKHVPGIDYVMLPLYSVRKHEVAPKSGLNQWNAGGRPRHHDEVYIPIPKTIHKLYPDFFPPRDVDFTLYLPDGKSMSAKICQADGKALMSNPNRSLGEWILRKILNKQPGELVTMDDLNRYGFNSVCVENLHTVDNDGRMEYRISFAEIPESYNNFIGMDE